VSESRSTCPHIAWEKTLRGRGTGSSASKYGIWTEGSVLLNSSLRVTKTSMQLGTSGSPGLVMAHISSQQVVTKIPPFAHGTHPLGNRLVIPGLAMTKIAASTISYRTKRVPFSHQHVMTALSDCGGFTQAQKSPNLSTQIR
jgi:hypothetical protein